MITNALASHIARAGSETLRELAAVLRELTAARIQARTALHAVRSELAEREARADALISAADPNEGLGGPF